MNAICAAPSQPHPYPDNDLVCYQALKAHDARFDGHFFVGVSSTHIYCRPVCRVKLPKFENCRFFDHAALAESAGYRPCLRCRPELAPRNLPWSTSDASRTLALQAARWLDDPQAWQTQPGADDDVKPSISQLAAHLGVSDRHVRRLFEAEFGVSPLQYLQTRRLLTAKQLLTDTDMPIAQVALCSGFGSVRRFSAAFLAHYRLNPTQLRHSTSTAVVRSQRPIAPSSTGFCTVKLSYRPPYNHAWMLAFFQKRQINAIEFAATELNKSLAGWTFSLESGGQQYLGWVIVEFLTEQNIVMLHISDSLRDVLPQVIRQVRGLLDLDADPMAINAVLGDCFSGDAADKSAVEGLRVPGCLNGFELAVRAILGQQVTVAAGRTLTQRLVDRFGTAIKTPYPALSRLFPTPASLAAATGEDLGGLGIVKQRQMAIQTLAQQVVDKQLLLHPSVDSATALATMAALRALPGVGDWTAQYIAMRALRWPDAFVAGDVALHKAMGLQNQSPPLSPTKTAAAALAASQVWRPWRSYAVMRAWTSLSAPSKSNSA